MIAKAEPNVVWSPIPGIDGRLSSQGLLLSCRANIIFAHGPRGNGKTAGQLMKFRSNVGRGWGRHYRGIILDLESKDLDDIVSQSEELFGLFDDGAVFLRSKGSYIWKWPTGEELLIRTAIDEREYKKFHGHSYTFVGHNEITKRPTRDFYDLMFSVNRCAFDPIKDTPKIQVNGEWVYATENRLPLPRPILQTVLTGNPNGPGHNWVKSELIDPIDIPGKIIYKTKELYDPIRREKRKVTVSQTAIFGNFYENQYVTDEYRLNMEKLCGRNENLRQAWIFGNWDISAGGALDDLWNKDVHVIPRFKIPDNWRVDRSLDWGMAHPYAIPWFAEANGEEVKLHDGSSWCPPRGTLFVIAEEYGGESSETNKGNRRGARDVAIDILQKESFLLAGGWISSTPEPGPADSDICSKKDSEQQSVETIMTSEGVTWLKADKSKNSRKNGLVAFRSRLEASLDGELPGIYFFSNCKFCIETIRSIPLDPDDPDDVYTKAIDHCYDAVRYKIYEIENRPPLDLVVNRAK